MKPSVRVVCGTCLQSLDLSPDSAGHWPALCPVCGGTIDSRSGDVSTPETRIEFTAPTVERGGKVEQRWARVWQEGTLGTFSRFQIREQLGDGGFGTVFKAYDPRLDRDVALKVLKQREPGERVRERFFREARAAARLKHANIAAVHDAGSEDGRCWVAFEHVVGRPLSRWLENEGKPALAVAVRIVRDLAEALDHAHTRGVFHRDLKPANVMIDEKGRPLLIDFGLSRFDDIASDLTHDGGVVGTPNYMPPEQLQGHSREADGRSDLYSLGVVFYELLTGQRAIESPSASPPWGGAPGPSAATIKPPRTLNREIPPVIDRICMKALDPDPSRRYQNARLLVRDLDRWLKIHDGSTGVSFLVATVLLGIAGSILLIAGLKFTLESATPAVATSRIVASAAPVPLVGLPSTAKPRVDSEAVLGEDGPYYCVPKASGPKFHYHYFENCVANSSMEPLSWSQVTDRNLPLCSRCRTKWEKQEKERRDSSFR